MSSSPTYTLVDKFDEDEFPDIPTAQTKTLWLMRRDATSTGVCGFADDTPCVNLSG